MKKHLAVRKTVIAVIVLVTLHLFLFNDLFGTINTLSSDVMKAIKVSSPPSSYLVEDAEKWKSYVLLKNIPMSE
jgi:hypothetical protein